MASGCHDTCEALFRPVLTRLRRAAATRFWDLFLRGFLSFRRFRAHRQAGTSKPGRRSQVERIQGRAAGRCACPSRAATCEPSPNSLCLAQGLHRLRGRARVQLKPRAASGKPAKYHSPEGASGTRPACPRGGSDSASPEITGSVRMPCSRPADSQSVRSDPVHAIQALVPAVRSLFQQLGTR